MTLICNLNVMSELQGKMIEIVQKYIPEFAYYILEIYAQKQQFHKPLIADKIIKQEIIDNMLTEIKEELFMKLYIVYRCKKYYDSTDIGKTELQYITFIPDV